MSLSRSSACVREKDDGAENGAWGKAWSFMGQRAVNLDIGARGRLRYCTSNSAFPGGKLNPFQFYNPAVTSSYKYVQTTEQLIQGQWTHITVDHRASTNAAVSCQTCACCSRHTCVGKCTKVGKGQWCSNGWVGNQDPPAGIVTIRMQLGSAAVADSARTTVVLDLQRMHLFVDGSAQRGARLGGFGSKLAVRVLLHQVLAAAVVASVRVQARAKHIFGAGIVEEIAAAHCISVASH